MRQTFKDGMGRIFQRPATHTEYTTNVGIIRVDNKTHRVVTVPAILYRFDGMEVYAAGGWLYNVASAKKLYPFTRSRRIHVQGDLG